MAVIPKYTPINGGTLISDIKTHFSILKTKRTIALAYVVVFIFIAFTIFSPWFTNIFTVTTTKTPHIPSSVFSDQSYRSHFSSFYYYFFPNSSSSQTHNAKSQKNDFLPPNLQKEPPVLKNQTKNEDILPQKPLNINNQTENKQLHDKVEVLKQNQNVTENGEKGIAENGGVVKKLTYFQQKNSTDITKVKKGSEFDDLIKSLLNCDMFDGNWVRDESYPLYKPGSCSLIDEQFNCFLNGRPDNGYLKLKWKPKGCILPRLNGSHMLEMLRGKRLVFVGDSLNRNMWESLICILRNSVKDQKKVYEEFGRHHFRTEASYSFVFEDYKCTVEFFVSPFLVQEWEVADKNATKKETLRLDLISSSADTYKNADIIVFNTGHWWTHEKTSKGKDYYQEGSHVYSELNAVEAFRRAITTWGRWVDSNVDQMKSLVFFRGYSASHFR